MTAVAVARGFVNDAMSKIVSSVMGSAGAGDPSSPGSPASLRKPYAWWNTTLPPWPITTTAPGSRRAGIASFISLETVAKSGVRAASGGNVGVGAATGASAGGSGACVACGLLPTAVFSASPREHAVANTSTTAPTAIALRTDGFPSTRKPLSGGARCTNDHMRAWEIDRHLRACLAQCRGAVAVVSVLGMDPDPDVHLTADKLTEHHSDCLRSVFGDQPHGVLGVDPSQRRADLFIETAGRPAGAVTGGTDIRCPGSEEVSVRLAGELPQYQALAGTLRPLDQRKGQLAIQVVEFGRDPLARVLGE